MIPQLDGLGLIPPGVWDCTFAEIENAFCWNDHRRALWADLTRFLTDVYAVAAPGMPVWIDGSFTRSKPLPADIDLVIDFSSEAIDAVAATMISLRKRAADYKRDYHLDVWVRHPELPRDLAEFFQYVGDKAAAELSLQPTDPKGILRVSP
jgi:hypothetical protein